MLQLLPLYAKKFNKKKIGNRCKTDDNSYGSVYVKLNNQWWVTIAIT